MHRLRLEEGMKLLATWQAGACGFLRLVRNRRKMEAAVTDPEVAQSTTILCLSLHGRRKEGSSRTYQGDRKRRHSSHARTYGDKWSYLQRSKFGANAQPFHVIVDNNGRPLAPAFVYKEDIPAISVSSNQGIENYKK